MNEYLWKVIIERLNLNTFPIKSYQLDADIGVQTITVTYYLTDDALSRIENVMNEANLPEANEEA